MQEFLQALPLGLVQPVIQVLGEVGPEVEYRIRVFRDHFVDLRQAVAVGGVELADKILGHWFVADPGGKYKGKTGELLPGLSQIVDIGGSLPLFQGPVADDDTGRPSFDMVPEIVSAIHYPWTDLPIFFQKDLCQLHGSTTLIVQDDLFNLVDGSLAEDTDGGYG